MGADLIGYIFMGPNTLEATQLTTAKNYLLALKATAEEAYAIVNDFDEAHRAKTGQGLSLYRDFDGRGILCEKIRLIQAEKEAYYKLKSGELSAAVERMCGDLDTGEYFGTLFEISGLGVDSFLEDLVAVWQDCGARDSMERIIGDKRIVFAGEMSWGDTPEGYGFTTLQLADRLEVLHYFGIE